MRRRGGKFSVQNDPLENEASLPVIMPANEAETNQLISIATQLQSAPNATLPTIQALEMWKSQVEMDKARTTYRQEFLVDFWKWLLGIGKEQDHKKTAWGRQKLTGDPEVQAYVDQFVEKRQEFQIKLELLKRRVPVGINAAYLYFKYVVRGAEVDDTNFLSDWKIFLDAFDENPGKPIFNKDSDSRETRPNTYEDKKAFAEKHDRDYVEKYVQSMIEGFQSLEKAIERLSPTRAQTVPEAHSRTDDKELQQTGDVGTTAANLEPTGEAPPPADETAMQRLQTIENLLQETARQRDEALERQKQAAVEAEQEMLQREQASLAQQEAREQEIRAEAEQQLSETAERTAKLQQERDVLAGELQQERAQRLELAQQLQVQIASKDATAADLMKSQRALVQQNDITLRQLTDALKNKRDVEEERAVLQEEKQMALALVAKLEQQLDEQQNTMAARDGRMVQEKRRMESLAAQIESISIATERLEAQPEQQLGAFAAALVNFQNYVQTDKEAAKTASKNMTDAMNNMRIGEQSLQQHLDTIAEVKDAVSKASEYIGPEADRVLQGVLSRFDHVTRTVMKTQTQTKMFAESFGTLFQNAMQQMEHVPPAALRTIKQMQDDEVKGHIEAYAGDALNYAKRLFKELGFNIERSVDLIEDAFLNAEGSDLNSKIDHMLSALKVAKEAEQEAATYAREIAGLKEQIGEYQQQINMLMSKEAAEAERKQIQAETRRIEEQKNAAEAKLQKMKEEERLRKELTTEVGMREQQLESAKQTLAEERRIFDEMTNAMRQRIEEANASAEKADADLAVERQRHSNIEVELNQHLRTVQGQLFQLQSHNEQLTEDLATKIEELGNSQTELDDANATVEKLEQEKKNLDTTLAQTEDEVNTLKEEKAKLEKDLTTIGAEQQAKTNAALAAVEKRLTDAQAEIKLLERQIATQKAELKSAETRVKNAEKDTARLQKRETQLQKRVDASIKRIAELEKVLIGTQKILSAKKESKEKSKGKTETQPEYAITVSEVEKATQSVMQEEETPEEEEQEQEQEPQMEMASSEGEAEVMQPVPKKTKKRRAPK